MTSKQEERLCELVLKLVGAGTCLSALILVIVLVRAMLRG